MNSPSARPVLLLLAAANFVVGMGAFVVVGVLSPVAAAFAISSSAAGGLMTAYAVVYALSSPVLVALTGLADRRRVILAGLMLFGLGSVAAALAPNYAALLGARALMAIGGGLITPVAAAIGVSLVPPLARGKALATVFGGLTLAQVLGVPLGAWLGYALGWPAAFLVVALLAAACLVAMSRRLPAGIAVPPVDLATLLTVLGTPRQVLAVAFTTLFIGGMYVLYTFLAPFLEARLGLGRDGVTAMLVLFGAGAVVGNAMGGMLTDRIGPARALVILCLAQILLMPALTLLPLPIAPTAALIAAWSIFGWSFMVPQQARLAALDPARMPVLLALNAAAIYVGASLGSAVGGWTLDAGGFPALGLSGAALAAAGLGSVWLVGRMQRD